MVLDPDEGAHAAQRWSARLSLAAAALGVLLPMIFAGTASLILLVVGLGGMAVTAASVWWVLTRRGLIRIAAAVLAVAAPLTVIGFYDARNLLWVVMVALALWGVAVWAGRTAIRSTGYGAVPVPEYE
ncbi:diacylglycerol kinase, partial [Streptomyces sp. 2MCAF27]